jgi:hypothetical protein
VHGAIVTPRALLCVFIRRVQAHDLPRMFVAMSTYPIEKTQILYWWQSML